MPQMTGEVSRVIISHRYRYVFVEVPRTASTAISAELRANYDGQSILEKHSYYSTFLRQASEDEKQYRVFSGIRNPLDDVVSFYRKLCTKKESGFKRNRRVMKRARFVRERSASFSEYLNQFYKIPFDLWTSTYHRRFDYVLRFEHLQEDFAQVIRMIGADLVRPLPHKNKTDRKKDFLSYFTPSDISKAVWVFGPYMKTWGYEFPKEWGNPKVPQSSWILFKTLAPFRKLYWNHIRQGRSTTSSLVRKLLFETRNSKG